MDLRPVKFKIDKFILFLFLIVLPIYLTISLFFLDKSYFISPLEYKGDIIIRYDSRGDGSFASPRNGNREHRGIDLVAPVGSPVLAAASGKVAVVRDEKMGMGKYIVISHPAGVITLYGHLSEIYTRKNQWVRQGEVIGKTGKTGNANSPSIQPHLHFEVRKQGIAQDPREHLE